MHNCVDKRCYLVFQIVFGRDRKGYIRYPRRSPRYPLKHENATCFFHFSDCGCTYSQNDPHPFLVVHMRAYIVHVTPTSSLTSPTRLLRTHLGPVADEVSVECGEARRGPQDGLAVLPHVLDRCVLVRYCNNHLKTREDVVYEHLLLSIAKEHSGSSKGNMWRLPWHDKIRCRLKTTDRLVSFDGSSNSYRIR